MPGLFLRFGITVSYRPLNNDSFRCLAFIALSLFANSIYAILPWLDPNDLPDRLLRVFVLANRYSYDLAALLKVLGQLLLVGTEVHVLYENAAGVRIVVTDRFVLRVVMGFRVVLV